MHCCESCSLKSSRMVKFENRLTNYKDLRFDSVCELIRMRHHVALSFLSAR
jgi:hypothetical protein